MRVLIGDTNNSRRSRCQIACARPRRSRLFCNSDLGHQNYAAFSRGLVRCKHSCNFLAHTLHYPCACVLIRYTKINRACEKADAFGLVWDDSPTLASALTPLGLSLASIPQQLSFGSDVVWGCRCSAMGKHFIVIQGLYIVYYRDGAETKICH